MVCGVFLLNGKEVVMKRMLLLCMLIVSNVRGSWQDIPSDARSFIDFVDLTYLEPISTGKLSNEQIKKSVNLFEKKHNVFKEKLECSIKNFKTWKKPKLYDLKVLRTKLVDLIKRLEEARLRAHYLVVRSSSKSPAELYEQLKESYKENFAPVKGIWHIAPNKVYIFLGLDPTDAREKSVDDIRSVIQKKKREMSQMGILKKSDLNSLFRQIEYLFRDSLAKKQYDLFLEGEDAVGELMIDNSLFGSILESYNLIGNYKASLDALRRDVDKSIEGLER